MKRIAIIGGGAAGLAAAVSAGLACRDHRSIGGEEVEIAIFEATERIGRPILASGNGRCNFSNSHIDATRYHNNEFASAALNSFESLMSGEGFPGLSSSGAFSRSAPNGVVRFFESLGLLWREEGEGRLYPKANKSSSVLDVLRAAVAITGAEVRTEVRVERVEPPRSAGNEEGRSGRFVLRMADGAFERADAVIVACGGAAARDMLPDAFGFVPQQPVLGPMATDTHWVKQLDNIRVKCAVELWRDGRAEDDCGFREEGEVLFRKYGISGIAAFNLSRFAQPGDVLSIDLFPDMGISMLQEKFEQRLIMLKRTFGEDVACNDLLRGVVLPQVANVLCEYAGLEGGAPCTRRNARALARACKRFQMQYRGIGDSAQCQVRRGGFAPVGNFIAESLQAVDMPGLFVVGEALDVDGPCGGYNLHWAFATGVMAGIGAVAVCA